MLFRSAGVASLKSKEIEASRKREDQLKQIEVEFAQEVGMGTPDAGRLGSLYVAAEILNRESKAGLEQVAAGFRALLTPTQLSKLPILQDSFRVTLIANDAACEGLLGSLTMVLPGVLYFPQARLFCGVSVLLPESPSQSKSGELPLLLPLNPAIRVYLDLPEAQMAAIASLVAETLEHHFQIRIDRGNSSIAVFILAQASSLDATAIGLRLAELDRFDKESLRIETDMVLRVAEVLTDGQRVRVDELIRTLRLFSGGRDVSCAGFAPRYPTSAGFPTSIRGFMAHRFFAFQFANDGCWTPAAATLPVSSMLRQPVTLPLQQRRVN